MPNTIKIPTVFWAFATLGLFPYYLPSHNGMFAFQLVLALVCALLAYFSYRAAWPDTAAAKWKIGVGYLIVGGIVALVGLPLAIQNFPLSFSGPSLPMFSASIEGRYADPQGFAVEFLADGTLLANTANGQQVLKWAAYDGNRMKLEGTGFAANAAMCAYEVSTSTLKISDCPVTMTLTRM